MHIATGVEIEEDELSEQFVRASGPGGQNVNKVSTAVQLRYDAGASPGLDAAVLARLRTLAGRRMTADGVIIIDARRFRTRERNRDDARERLFALLREASRVPTPRRKTRPTAGSRERRLSAKRVRGSAKRLRRPPGDSE